MSTDEIETAVCGDGDILTTFHTNRIDGAREFIEIRRDAKGWVRVGVNDCNTGYGYTGCEPEMARKIAAAIDPDAFDRGIAEGLERAARMLEEEVAGAIRVLDVGLRSDPDHRQRVAWEAARDVMLVTVAPLATRIRALVAR